MRTSVFTSFLPAAVLCGAFFFFGCAHAPEQQHTSYETVTLVRDTVVAPMTWSAAMRGKADVSIVSRRNGTLKEVLVRDGQRVKKGDVLFRLDARRAENTLAHAQADLLTAIANRDNARLEAQSNADLYEKGIISDYLLHKSQNLLQSAEAQVAQAQVAIRDAELDLSNCTLTSPVDGLVGDVGPHVGDRIEIGDVITRVAGTSQMEATFSLTESQVHALVNELGSLDEIKKVAPELTFRFKDGTEYAHKGRITSVSGMVDQRTGSVTCYVTFPNPQSELFSGMQGTVVMPLQWEGVILIPLTSIVRLQNKVLVYEVGADSLASSVLIEMEDLGDGAHAVVVSGLQPGQTIVAKGAANVHEKDRVIW